MCCFTNPEGTKIIYLFKISIFPLFCRSRDAVFSVISRLTQRTEKFTKDKAKRDGDTAWIEQKLKDGNFLKVCDISKSQSTPTKDLGQLTLSPKRTSPVTVDNEDSGRGKRIKFHKPSCNLSCCSASSAKRVLFVNEVLELVQMAEDEVVPDDGDPDYVDESTPKPKSMPKTKTRPSFASAIALQERFNTPDTQAALWWNVVSM